MSKILLIEDDISISETMKDWLENERYVVEIANNGELGLELILNYKFDVAVIDWELPHVSGVEIMRKLRAARNPLPTLMLTGKKDISDKEIGLDAGADDYLTKPFEMRELSARIRALLRRSPTMRDECLTAGHIVLDLAKGVVTRNGEEVKLMPKEFALLKFMMMHPQRLFNNNDLLDHVWTSDSEATENALRTYITRIRQKIDEPGAPSLIKTVHGLGYRFGQE